ncbi:MAG: biotin/lipoyl-binding protein [Myxococcales bacterium]|nr:biotin/lipoyl-binding protein [Myxococcales bacterium]
MKLRITVHGVAYEVEVEVIDAGDGVPAANSTLTNLSSAAVDRALGRAPQAPPPVSAPAPAPGVGPGEGVAAPIAGTVQEIKCRPGQAVGAGEVLLVVEAMKMMTNITAPAAGKVKAVPVSVGDAVREGQLLVAFE